MAYFVLFVLHDVAHLDNVLSAWENAGVQGVTIMTSTGLGRIRHKKLALREDLPLIPSLNDLLSDQHEELLNRTLFSVVEDDALIERIVEGTEQVLGSLDQPNTGILAVLPISRVYGLKKNSQETTRHNNPGDA